VADLLTLLSEKGVVSARDVDAFKEEAASSGASVESVLQQHGIAPRDILAVKGEHWQLPVREVGDKPIPFEVLQYISEESAVHYKAVPLGVEDGALLIGVIDPDNIEALDALNFLSARVGMPCKIFLISEQDFQKVLHMYKGLSGEVGQALNELETEISHEGVEGLDVDKEEEELEHTIAAAKTDDDSSLHEDAPVTKIVATLLRNAVEGRASDVHIEPTSEKVRVRFRVDGVLHTSIVLPLKVHRAVVARVKILASLKLDERRKPQDGRFSATIAGRRIDFRVSTFPTHYGEKVVMRILDKERGTVTLEQLGMSPRYIDMVRQAIKKPYGLILITGPTGSGKSTTLYSMLSEVDRDGFNVISLEDPVEYNIEGVAQSQVRPEIGYTFANGLRSVLRQDPDIIMVGEIRDKETAQLAVQAALTGHLVFSTLHTNNAPGAVPRLVDMGVDPYLIAPTLELVIAQRLVRTLCEDGGKPIKVEGNLKGMLDRQFADLPAQYHDLVPTGDTLYGIMPTKTCPSGTRGRTGVFEMMTFNDELEQAILDSAEENKVYELARKNGMLTMKEDGIIKAFNKEIPFEEVNTLGGEYMLDEEPVSTPATEVPPEEAIKETTTSYV
jgi:type IV pilus assembly protein PilB